jgi:hypothetical protein
MKVYVVAVVLIAIAASAQESLPPQIRAEAARLDAAMHSAEDYCREIDSFTSQNPPIVLTSDSVGSNWHRQLSPSEPTLASRALVWTQANLIVAVKMWTPELTTRFGPVSYCFRNDGTVARISVAPTPSHDRDLPSLRKTVAVGRQWFFDETGRRLAVAINQQDSAPLKSETTEYVYPAVHFFQRVRDLPFADVLREHTGPLAKVAQPSR